MAIMTGKRKASLAGGRASKSSYCSSCVVAAAPHAVLYNVPNLSCGNRRQLLVSRGVWTTPNTAITLASFWSHASNLARAALPDSTVVGQCTVLWLQHVALSKGAQQAAFPLDARVRMVRKSSVELKYSILSGS